MALIRATLFFHNLEVLKEWKVWCPGRGLNPGFPLPVRRANHYTTEALTFWAMFLQLMFLNCKKYKIFHALLNKLAGYESVKNAFAKSFLLLSIMAI